jgi:glyoxylase-like metal-dependent hydrolase (beta-lactamase superfamily II)
VAAAAISLAPGVWRIPTAPADLVNTYAFRDDDGQVTLVDAGVKSAPPRILAALAAIGSAPQDVTRIVLTHGHGDHAGGAAGLKASTGAPIAIHPADADAVRAGTSPPIDRSTWVGKIVRRMPGSPAAHVSEELHDGQTLDVAGGLRVIHTPGHSPGHVSLLHEPTRILITGDAIWNVRSTMSWSIRFFCADIAMTERTAHVLGEVEYDVAAFTHGPHIDDGAREAVRSFLREPRRFRGGF